MKFLPSIVIAYLGAAWALPQPPQTEGLIYIPCGSVTLFDAAYCCTRGLLGNVSEYASSLSVPPAETFLISSLSSCTLPLLPLSDQNFEDQCTLFKKTAVCCIPPLLLQPPTLCIPLPASAT
ncbi:hypothetical protein F5Y09DRAFT_312753 [Xylaria sp. FL1042]|nr:hypothetical protein F5Y09DRAFT_312753 [Xylaria sp. FL1042]